MRNEKYKILRCIRNASTARPARKSDFLKNTTQIMQKHITIEELIESQLIKTRPGSDHLYLTGQGIIALDREEERREDVRRLSIQFWISIGLSAAAITVSILALILNA